MHPEALRESANTRTHRVFWQLHHFCCFLIKASNQKAATMAPKTKKKPPPKGHAVAADPYEGLPKNEKGKYTSWRSGTPAADMLKVLVRGGSVDGMTAGQIQKCEMYAIFDQWENNCFSSALTNMRKQYKKEIEVARGTGSEGRRFFFLFVPFWVCFSAVIANNRLLSFPFSAPHALYPPVHRGGPVLRLRR